MTATHQHDIPLRQAYASLWSFFNLFPLAQAVQQVNKLAATAAANHSWRSGAPADLLFFMEHLQELCRAADHIHYHDRWATHADITATDDGLPDLLQTAHYVNPQYGGTPWDCMPRHLSARQYQQPGRVLAKFAQTMAATEWQHTLKLLLDFALSYNSIEGCLTPGRLLLARRRLLQLVEACHLVVVRMQQEKPATVKKGKKKATL